MSTTTPHPWPTCDDHPLLGANGTESMGVLLERDDAHLVDYLKVGPFMGEAAIAALAPDYPLLLHLDLTLSTRDLPAPNVVRRCRCLVDLTGTPWTSAHIAYGAADAQLSNALHAGGPRDLLSREEALANIVRNASYLQQQLPVPLLLENIPCFPTPAHRHVCEPEFIASIIDCTGCGLLLDLAHARVSADVLRYDVHDYLAGLPLSAVVEFHISGPRPVREARPRLQELARALYREPGGHSQDPPYCDSSLIDAHEPMRPDDYALLGWALERTQPRAISLEYFWEADGLEEQLERLGQIIGR